MTTQAVVVKLMILLEPDAAHVASCPGHKNPEKCNCYLINNARTRAAALEEAGLLRPMKKEK